MESNLMKEVNPALPSAEELRPKYIEICKILNFNHINEENFTFFVLSYNLGIINYPYAKA